MGGIDINRLRIEMIRSACDLWHELTGGELVWVIESAEHLPDFRERMEIANLSGATWRG